jgi:hypothetical protein
VSRVQLQLITGVSRPLHILREDYTPHHHITSTEMDSRHQKRKPPRAPGALSLAPLTTTLDEGEVHAPTTSYLRNRSLPSTPSILPRSPARSTSRERLFPMPKSRSATQLHSSSGHHKRKSRGGARSGSASPTGQSAQAADGNDWLVRVGSLIGSETRESKGTGWLATRDSSTSLAGMRDAEEEVFEREAYREWELGAGAGSRRGSVDSASGTHHQYLVASPPGSRLGSRSGSRRGSRTPRARRGFEEGYFTSATEEHVGVEESAYPGPDFVGLDEALEALDVSTETDEEHVHQLVKRERGLGSWIGSFLFSVSEAEDETSAGELTDTEPDEEWRLGRSSSVRQLQGDEDRPEPSVEPPKENEGGWQDAAWLLNVASKVIL